MGQAPTTFELAINTEKNRGRSAALSRTRSLFAPTRNLNKNSCTSDMGQSRVANKSAGRSIASIRRKGGIDEKGRVQTSRAPLRRIRNGYNIVGEIPVGTTQGR